jgi:hypothetical protein
MRDGTYRGFITHHVWADVPRVLEDVRSPASGSTLSGRMSCGGGRICRYCAPCAPPGLPMTSEADRLTLEDPTDVPTLQLHGVTAPAVLVASDRDLRRSGLVPEPWPVVRRAVRDVGIPEGKAREVTNFAGSLVEGTLLGVGPSLQGRAGERLGRGHRDVARGRRPPDVSPDTPTPARAVYSRCPFATLAMPRLVQHGQGSSIWAAAETGTPGTTLCTTSLDCWLARTDP